MELFYRQYGKGSPLLILHGLLGLSDNWVSIANKLSNNFHVIIPDLRNHGQSFHADEMNYDVLANDVIELCFNLNIDKCSIIGHSMGGKTAVNITHKIPTLIDKLIIVDIGVGETVKNAANMNFLLSRIHNLNIEQFHERSQIANYLDNNGFDKKILQLLLKNIYFNENKQAMWRFNWKIIIQHIDNILAALNLTHVIDNKALFIKGSLSDYLDDRAIREIYQWFTDVAVVQIPNAGHWVHADNSNAFINEVLYFLQ